MDEKQQPQRDGPTDLNDSDAGHLVHLRPDVLDGGVGHCRVRIAATVDHDRARRLLHLRLRVDEELCSNGKVAELPTFSPALGPPLEREVALTAGGGADRERRR